jgi:CspA family cold shock protein
MSTADEIIQYELTGKVKWFSPEKGYGFILAGQAKDVFVHYRAILTKGFKTLEEGQTVTFDLAETPKGLEARGVRIVEDAVAGDSQEEE